MGSLTNYAENKLLDHAFGGSTFTQPGAYYLGLSTADPTEDGSGLAEPSGNNYARTQIGSFSAASGRAKSNSAEVQFPVASGPWGTLTHYVVVDAASGGNILAHGALADPDTVVSGGAPVLPIGEITITFAGSVAGAIDATVISDYLANKLLDHFFGGSTFSQPGAYYLAFSTADMLADNSGLAEPSGNGYARTQITAWAAASGGQKTNSADVQFPQATGAWGSLTHGGVYDASSGGNLLWGHSISNPQSPVSPNAPKVASGQIVITVD